MGSLPDSSVQPMGAWNRPRVWLGSHCPRHTGVRVHHHSTSSWTLPPIRLYWKMIEDLRYSTARSTRLMAPTIFWSSPGRRRRDLLSDKSLSGLQSLKNDLLESGPCRKGGEYSRRSAVQQPAHHTFRTKRQRSHPQNQKASTRAQAAREFVRKARSTANSSPARTAKPPRFSQCTNATTGILTCSKHATILREKKMGSAN